MPEADTTSFFLKFFNINIFRKMNSLNFFTYYIDMGDNQKQFIRGIY